MKTCSHHVFFQSMLWLGVTEKWVCQDWRNGCTFGDTIGMVAWYRGKYRFFSAPGIELDEKMGQEIEDFICEATKKQKEVSRDFKRNFPNWKSLYDVTAYYRPQHLLNLLSIEGA